MNWKIGRRLCFFLFSFLANFKFYFQEDDSDLVKPTRQTFTVNHKAELQDKPVKHIINKDAKFSKLLASRPNIGMDTKCNSQELRELMIQVFPSNFFPLDYTIFKFNFLYDKFNRGFQIPIKNKPKYLKNLLKIWNFFKSISQDSSVSKRLINNQAEAKFGGSIDVICSKGHFSYVYNSNLFCEAKKGDITCIAFRQTLWKFSQYFEFFNEKLSVDLKLFIFGKF